MKTINVNTWGRGSLGTLTVRVAEPFSAAEAVQRSIERRTGLTLRTWYCGGVVMEQGSWGTRHYCHYQGTLAKRRKDGSYDVYAQIWAAVPVN